MGEMLAHARICAAAKPAEQWLSRVSCGIPSSVFREPEITAVEEETKQVLRCTAPRCSVHFEGREWIL